MAIRSTDNAVRMPQAPQFFKPDFDLILKDLAMQQARYDEHNDELSSAKIKAYGETDTQRRGELLKEIENQKNALADVFMNEGRAKGNRALSQSLRSYRQMFLPGGEGYEINENALRREKFEEYLKTLTAAGKITSDRAEAAKLYYDNQFKGTQFNKDTGTFNTFEYNPLAESVNVYDVVDQRIKGYIPDMHERGKSYIGKDGYIHYQNKNLEWVSSDVVAADLVGALRDDPKLTSYFNEGINFGVETPESINQILTDAINYGSSKAGFTRDSFTDRITGASEELKQRHRIDLEDYKNNIEAEKNSEIFEHNSGAYAPGNNTFKILDPDSDHYIGPGSAIPPGYFGEKEKTDKYIPISIHEMFDPNSELYQQKVQEIGIDNFQQMNKAYESVMSEGVNYSDKEIESKVRARLEDRKKALDKAEITYTTYNTDEAKERTATLLGPANENGLGPIADSNVLIRRNGKLMKSQSAISYIKDLGYDFVDFKKNAWVYGETRADNPLTASGEEMTVVRKDGSVDKVTVTNRSLQDLQQKSGYWTLLQPKSSGTLNRSSSVVQGRPLTSFKSEGYNRDDKYIQDFRIFEAARDEDGTPIIDPSTGDFVPDLNKPVSERDVTRLQQMMEIEFKEREK